MLNAIYTKSRQCDIFLMTTRCTHQVSNMLSKPNFSIFDGSGCNYSHLKYIKISSIEDPLKDEVMKILSVSFTTVLLLEQSPRTPLSYLSKSAVSAMLPLFFSGCQDPITFVVPVLLVIVDELKY